ncbi:MAG: hypothetical protein IJ740_13415 [Ruminococcus sp.]|nr:hypothetical protein [Ruminococcus sp.]
MDKAQALHSFWSSFSLPAYDENTVPDGAQLPYITYEVSTASFDDGDIPLSASLWAFGRSWADISQKADEISQRIGFGGITIKTDTGYIWIKRRAPFAQRMGESDDNIRRIVLGISAEFIDI